MTMVDWPSRAVWSWISAGPTGHVVHHHPSQIAIYGAGDQWAHNNMPPFLALPFIIRFE